MTNTRLLWLAPAPGTPAHCLDLDRHGGVLAEAWLDEAATTAVASANTARCVLVVPGAEVRVAWLDLAAHNAVQAAAAARVLLADALASADDLHVAVAPARSVSPPSMPTTWLVAAVERQRLRGWLARAAALGLAADAVVPEQLLLPTVQAPALGVFDTGGRRLVRGERLAFSAEPALADLVVGGRRCSPVDAASVYPSALAPDIDLLQAEFALRPPQEHGGRRRRLAWLALALLASPLVLEAAQAVRLEVSARQLEARADALAGPGAAGGPHGDRAADLQALATGATPTDAAAALFAAVAAIPGTRLDALEHRRGDLLRATVAHPKPMDLESLRDRLAAGGWRLAEGGSVAAAGGHRTTIALERVE